ncbi:GAF domain-containing protein [Arthrobacter antioxidans]|uniref:GAF domain-containing protein n=1 Tax=Arthrobacter antioxidans TaxID=2895818 RepID=UPI001FFEF2A1|nr:GAF domain-containing protein [Arthrobacter antioxidans]
MISQDVQQWMAVQALRSTDFDASSVGATYAGLGGMCDVREVVSYLEGSGTLPAADRDLVAHALNAMIDDRGLPVDGAHYSTDEVADVSGFGDNLRVLVLDPDGHRFDRPAATAPYGVAGDGQEIDGTAEEDEDAEYQRCHALYETGLLDTGAEDRFDRYTRRAREHFGVSSSSIALITEDRQVIKSVVGPIGQDLPRDTALCSRTIEASRVLVITDAWADPEYRDHPLVVGGPRIRFYAGYPITTADGWRIGTLCIIDDRPRSFSDADALDLQRMALDLQIEIWVGDPD